jgi:hypothetical protein
VMSVERQVRTLVRAWPIPDRTERGDEIVGTTLDLVPDGQSRLTMALAFNLVLGGLRARWRMRPPLWRWLFYRMGGRLPSWWHRWMLNDLTGPGWRRRMIQSQLILGVVSASLGIILAHAMLPPLPHPSSPKLVDPVNMNQMFLVSFGAFVVTGTLTTAWRARKLRNRRLAQHFKEQPPQNDPLPPLPLSQSGGGPEASGTHPSSC